VRPLQRQIRAHSIPTGTAELLHQEMQRGLPSRRTPRPEAKTILVRIPHAAELVSSHPPLARANGGNKLNRRTRPSFRPRKGNLRRFRAVVFFRGRY
jgi:hypothetical protein